LLLYWIFIFILFAAILISIFYISWVFLVGRLLLYFPFCCAAVWMLALCDSVTVCNTYVPSYIQNFYILYFIFYIVYCIYVYL
jgi:hypothetical protein